MNTSRKDFLTALGGLIATSALPSFADQPELFPTRGRFERLSLAYQHIKIGLKDPFSILHISDTHFASAYPHESEAIKYASASRMRTFGGRQEEAFRDSLAWAKKRVHFVLHTGDLIDFQSEANYDLVKKYLGEQTFYSLGNHEYQRFLKKGKGPDLGFHRKESIEELGKIFKCNVLINSKIINEVNFVSVSNINSVLLPEVIEGFHKEVKKGLPIILTMHVPFPTPEITFAANRFWRQHNKKFGHPLPSNINHIIDPATKDFVKYLKSEPLLKGILAGHTHLTQQDRFSPTAIQYVVGGNFMFHGQEILFT